MCGTDVFLAVLAVLFPPVAVWVKRGICSADSLINIALCCLGLLPGLFHAWYIIWTYPDPGPEYERVAGGDSEAHVTYYYVARGAPPRGAAPARAQPKPQNNQPYSSPGGPTYGTAAMPPPTHGQQFPGQESGTVNSFSNAPSNKQSGSSGAHAPTANGEGSASHQPPPTYAEAVRGDHKIQTQD